MEDKERSKYKWRVLTSTELPNIGGTIILKGNFNWAITHLTHVPNPAKIGRTVGVSLIGFGASGTSCDFTQRPFHWSSVV